MISNPLYFELPHLLCDPYPEISSAARAVWVQTVQEHVRLSKPPIEVDSWVSLSCWVSALVNGKDIGVWNHEVAHRKAEFEVKVGPIPERGNG